jgi:glucose-6-phosphate-specific signal transduction histidine kinase
VPRELWDHVIAVERELLANITKHAGATAVDIDAHVTDKLLLHPSWAPTGTVVEWEVPLALDRTPA